MRLLFLSLCSIVLVIGGCAAPAAPAAPSANGAASPVLRIVTTVSPITNIAYNIAGDRAQITGIVPEGVNSHTFEPAPSDAKTMAEADLIFINGLKLEEPTLALAEANKNDEAEIVLLGDLTVTPEEYVFDFSFPRRRAAPTRTCGPTRTSVCATPRSSATRWQRATRRGQTTTTPTTPPLPPGSKRSKRPSAPPSTRYRQRTASCSPTMIRGHISRLFMA
jgi:hypothetical protein